MTTATRIIGTPTERIDGPAKVAGTAPYAYEHDVDRPAFLYPITATIARGTVAAMDTTAATELDGVLKVLTPWNSRGLTKDAEGEYVVLQGPDVAFRGQLIGAVVAQTPETARHAASLVRVEYNEMPHDTEFRVDHPDEFAPESVNGGYPTTSDQGDVEAALSQARRNDDAVVDEWYSTPEEHNNPMEPHTVVAHWDPDQPLLTLHDSTQSSHSVAETVAKVLGLDRTQIRVVAPHVGGGFGSKGAPHAHDILAAMAALAVPGRSIKFAVTRQQMFVFVGHRSPTSSHIRIAADGDGRITALWHDAYSRSSTVKEFAEQSAVSSRSMYSAPNRRTSHHISALDVPAPFWMRAPGEAPGMFAGEVAMDELAYATEIDPVELRMRNEPGVDPESGKPWSSRRLVDCLRTGARQFGWVADDRSPAQRREGQWLVGTGVASATYPHMVIPGSQVTIRFDAGRYRVAIGAADIGTGAWTTLTLIAADALECRIEQVTMEIGDSTLPMATVAGGSSGTSSWGAAIVTAAHRFREEHGHDPDDGAETTSAATRNEELKRFVHASFGAHFAEVRVDADTGEIRIPRMLGVFSIGRVINPLTLRSQLIGGMTFGISMALHEESVRDPRFGHVVTQDLASYHVPVHADIVDVDATWLDDADERATPMGSRGAGEIGIVGSAAAVVNAIYHATGARIRDLPATADKVLPYLP
ncbi:xanthine dehydrogenase family protein molybdopterin-binding subunit [Aldersonia sp. NBC_00410]|uniref:xanthine dehydrogenase family protein molybdopterin-binding subunit n=1 Tax=Aldersonia sp. NBC_00410 TaxID=2975954 RepID=UPI0022549C9B|nr:xanthine dehydrogenase family protein molybdopterin-binding subunit [Aldersonia sp. NBC_00410]MCX5044132.1 xanthine dehydrogenase family protein molybdopterin-binding subunit [Aldersonia sp. NBC_00410]